MAMDRARDVLSAEQLCISLTLFRGFVPSISAHSSHTYNTYKPLCLSEKTMLKKLSAVDWLPQFISPAAVAGQRVGTK